MTITNPQTVQRYTGDGTNAVLPVPFVFDDDDDLRVWSRVIATGVQTLLVKGTHYTVSGGGGLTGSLTVINGAANFAVTVQWTIDRVTPRTQTTDLVSADALSEQSLEKELDKGCWLDQEIDSILARTIRFPVSDPGVSPELPSAVVRANRVLSFDSAGNPTVIANTVDPNLVAVSAFGVQVVGTADAAALRALVDVDAGAIASRPASGSAIGHLYFATDQGRAYVWTGAAWKELQIQQFAFSGLPAAGNTGAFFYDTTRRMLIYDGASLLEVRAPLPRGHIGGLKLTSALTSVTIAVGECRLGTSANRSIRNGYLDAALTKAINATWAAGTGNGGRAAGVGLATNTWYHVFLIAKPDGSLDAGFDTSVEAANLLADAAVIAAGFTLGNTSYRRIGSVLTDPATSILDFVQHGDHFTWTEANDASVAATAQNYATSGVLITIPGAPLGIRTLLHIRAQSKNFDLAAFRHGSYGAMQTPTDPPAGSGSLANTNTARGEELVQMVLLTDTSQRIKYRTAADASSDLYIQVDGWDDARGRWD